MTKHASVEPLLEKMARINGLIDATLGIELTDEDFADGREELLHIYCHEACHAALAHCVPWLHDLPEGEHTLVDEVLARLLEKVFAPRLGLFLHSDDEFLSELSMYPVDLRRGTFGRLDAAWESTFWPRHDLTGMAAHALMTLRHGGLVYHIFPRADWKAAQKAGIYRPASLESQGFIHFSRVEQVLPVAANFYSDMKDLLLLTIAVEKLEGEVRNEDLLGEGQGFPHLYGTLNLDAVVAVSKFNGDEDGIFRLPQQP
jgi:uncharacterized protein (DUF952 family)